MNDVYLWVYEDARGMANCYGLLAEHRSIADGAMGKFYGTGKFKLICCLKLDAEWVEAEKK